LVLVWIRDANEYVIYIVDVTWKTVN